MRKALVHTADPKELAEWESSQQRLRKIAALKRRSNTTGITWELACRHTNVDDFGQLCVELNRLCEESLVERKEANGADPSMVVHLKSDTSIPLS